jgi:sec-independent protein translocase protein TatA
MNEMLAMFGMGGTELLVVFGAILILFGAKKIPEFAKGLGQGMKEFKKASREVSEELENAMSSEPPPSGPKKLASSTPPETMAVGAHEPASAGANEVREPSGTVPKA